MNFGWSRIDKMEEYYIREIEQSTEQYVKEFYQVESLGDLTPDQQKEIEKFEDKLREINELNVMLWGLTHVRFEIENQWGELEE